MVTFDVRTEKEIVDLIKSGRRIDAVKLIKEHGFTLKESKSIMEDMIRNILFEGLKIGDLEKDGFIN